MKKSIQNGSVRNRKGKESSLVTHKLTKKMVTNRPKKGPLDKFDIYIISNAKTNELSIRQGKERKNAKTRKTADTRTEQREEGVSGPSCMVLI